MEMRKVSMKEKDTGIYIYSATIRFTTDHKLPENVWSEAVERNIRQTKVMVVDDLAEIIGDS